MLFCFLKFNLNDLGDEICHKFFESSYLLSEENMLVANSLDQSEAFKAKLEICSKELAAHELLSNELSLHENIIESNRLQKEIEKVSLNLLKTNIFLIFLLNF